MEIEAVVTDDDAWVPAVAFSDREDSPLVGTVSFPLPSFLTADEALEVVEATEAHCVGNGREDACPGPG